MRCVRKVFFSKGKYANSQANSLPSIICHKCLYVIWTNSWYFLVFIACAHRTADVSNGVEDQFWSESSSLCNKAAKAQVSLCKCTDSPMLHVCWSTIDIKSTTVFLIKLTLAIQMLDLWETFIFTGIILAQKFMRELIPFSQNRREIMNF